MTVPRIEDFGTAIHRQFNADLDFYMTQLLVGHAIEGKRDSVSLAPKVKDSIRAYVHGLRQAVDNATFDDSKRAALHKRLAEFEAELDKSRLSLLAVARLAVSIALVPGGLRATTEVVTKLTANLWQVVAQAKAADDENRWLPPTKPRVALMPPRREDEPNKPKSRGVSLAEELDDEIPF